MMSSAIRKDVPTAHIYSDHGREGLHPSAHPPRRRPLRIELDRRRARRCTRACPPRLLRT